MPTDQRLNSLLKQHEMLCPSCEYNLHTLSSGVCPECGTRLSFASVIRKNYGRSLRSIEYGIPFNFFVPPVVSATALVVFVDADPSKNLVAWSALAVVLAVSPFVYLVFALLILDKKELCIADASWRRRVQLTVWTPTILFVVLLPLILVLS